MLAVTGAAAGRGECQASRMAAGPVPAGRETVKLRLGWGESWREPAARWRPQLLSTQSTGPDSRTPHTWNTASPPALGLLVASESCRAGEEGGARGRYREVLAVVPPRPAHCAVSRAPVLLLPRPAFLHLTRKFFFIPVL